MYQKTEPRVKCKCQMKCLTGDGKCCCSTPLVTARNPPIKGKYPWMLDFLNRITMLGTARSAYNILHRRWTVHDCLGYNRTPRGWVPIRVLGAHRGSTFSVSSDTRAPEGFIIWPLGSMARSLGPVTNTGTTRVPEQGNHRFPS